MAEKKKYLKIKFHSFREDGCNVDADLSYTGKTVRNIRLKKEADGRLSFILPEFLKDGWNYKEITLEELYCRITEEYKKIYCVSEKKAVSKPPKAAPAAAAERGEPEFTFSALETKITVLADITFPDWSLSFKGVSVQGNLKDDSVFVKKPRELTSIRNFNAEKWNNTAADIEKCFRKRFMDYSEDITAPFEINFYSESTFYSCLASVRLPGEKRFKSGFLVRIHSDGRVDIKLPLYMKEWDNKKFNFKKLRQRMYCAVSEKYPVVSAFIPPAGSREKVSLKKYTLSGRIANAENSDFRYMPGSVLVDDGSVPESERKNLHVLAAVISKGEMGGIGPYEFGVLKWVARLRYATTVMIQELTYYGYIDTSWREKLNDKDKYSAIINRMQTFDMLQRSHFGTLDEDGRLKYDSFSVSKVLTVSRNGGMVLKEFSVDGSRYNSFDTIRDAYTIKSSLTVNQWLIYWLCAFKDRIGDNFDTAFIIRRIGAETTAARLYAVVQADDKVLVGEAVRRCAENAREVNSDALRNKLGRMIEIFDHPDEMYRETKKITYPSRPVINLVCEDDEHIKEVYEEIKDIMLKNPQQKIWFTHDLRVFNEDNMGQRFVSMDSGEIAIIDLAEVFGSDDETEVVRLREKFTKSEDGEIQGVENAEETGEENIADDVALYPDEPDEYSAEEYDDGYDENNFDTETEEGEGEGEEDFSLAWM